MLELLWRQFFREEQVLESRAFLEANLTLGLFGVVMLVAMVCDVERTSLLLTALSAVTVAAHLGGPLVVKARPRALAVTLFIQGSTLLCLTLGLVLTSTWLAARATTLSNVRWLPGLFLMLFLYSSFEIQFFGPGFVRRLPVRRLALVLGIASELSLSAALVWHLLKS